MNESGNWGREGELVRRNVRVNTFPRQSSKSSSSYPFPQKQRLVFHFASFDGRRLPSIIFTVYAIFTLFLLFIPTNNCNQKEPRLGLRQQIQPYIIIFPVYVFITESREICSYHFHPDIKHKTHASD